MNCFYCYCYMQWVFFHAFHNLLSHLLLLCSYYGMSFRQVSVLGDRYTKEMFNSSGFKQPFGSVIAMSDHLIILFAGT